MDIFGQATDVNTLPRPEHLPRPINDWALSLYILLQHPKGLTVFGAMKYYGMVKFQERLNEVLKEHPHLCSKERVNVKKRLNRVVQVINYKVIDEEGAIKVFQQLNVKHGSKSLNINNSNK